MTPFAIPKAVARGHSPSWKVAIKNHVFPCQSVLYPILKLSYAKIPNEEAETNDRAGADLFEYFKSLI